jgi:hypothetical protein
MGSSPNGLIPDLIESSRIDPTRSGSDRLIPDSGFRTPDFGLEGHFLDWQIKPVHLLAPSLVQVAGSTRYALGSCRKLCCPSRCVPGRQRPCDHVPYFPYDSQACSTLGALFHVKRSIARAPRRTLESLGSQVAPPSRLLASQFLAP